MQVKTQHGPNTAYVCSKHEDDASPKKVRELVELKEQEFTAFEQKAKELGYKLVPLNTETINPVKEVQSPVAIAPNDNTGAVVQKKHQINKANLRPLATTGIAEHGIEAHTSYDVPEQAAPQIIDHEEQVITGRGGVPVPIPKKIVSSAGTTEVAVVDTGGDKALQQRFKNLSDTRESHDFSKGYTKEAASSARPCTFCRGTGIAKIGKQACPKCKGSGLVG